VIYIHLLIVKCLLGKYFWVFLCTSLGAGVWIVFSGRVSWNVWLSY